MAGRITMTCRVGEIECANGNDDVGHDTQRTLEIVGLLVTEEGAHGQDCKDQSNGVKDGKVVVHVNTNSPANQDHERGVEQGGLNRGTEDMGKCHVDLVVVGFIDGEEMLGNLFDQGNENETNKGVADSTLYNVGDLKDEEDGHKRDAGQGNDKGDNDFDHGEFGLLQLLVAVLVVTVVFLVDFMEQTVVRDGLVQNVDEIGGHGNDGYSARDEASVLCDVDIAVVVGVLQKERVEDGGQDKGHYSMLAL